MATKPTIIIFHGIQGFSGWQNDIAIKLREKGYEVISPALPKPGRPVRQEWIDAGLEIIKSVKDKGNIIMVGHSLGVLLVADLLELIKTPIKLFISISGFSDDYGAELNSYYIKEKSVDFKKVIENSKKRIAIWGDDDPYVPQQTLEAFDKNLESDDTYIIEHGGHLSTGAGFTEFPLLLDLIEENS